MNVDVDRLRRYRADAEQAFAAARESHKRYRAAADARNALRVRLENEAARLQANPRSEEIRVSVEQLRAELEKAQEVLAAGGDALAAAQERSQLAGRIDRNCREYAESIGALPEDMRSI